MKIFDLLQNIATIFEDLEIPYMLGGSMAMNFYTVSRATTDIDIVVLLQAKDVDKLLLRLQNFYYNRDTVIEETQKKGMFNVIDHVTGFKIDFIILKDTEYSLTAFERRNLYNDLGFDVYVTSLEDLIIAKIQWIQQLYSDRQANDIYMLLQNPDKDMEYINNWTQKLNLNTYKLL